MKTLNFKKMHKNLSNVSKFIEKKLKNLIFKKMNKILRIY